MAINDRIQTGPQRKPLIVTMYGVPGVGKTTFGASAPKPIIYCVEDGAASLAVPKLPAAESWEGILDDLRELARNDFKTIVVDTLDALEVVAVQHVCTTHKKATLSDFDWGAGYALLVQEWRRFLKALEVLRDKAGMHIVLIAHEHRKAIDDPELGRYEMYRPKLQDKVWALTNEWSDNVLFAQFDAALLEKKDQKSRAIVTGRRVLRTVRGTGYVAKNRHSLPEVIDLDWQTLEMAAMPVPVELLQAQYQAALAKAPSEIQAKAMAWVAERKSSPDALRAMTERLEKSAEKAA